MVGRTQMAIPNWGVRAEMAEEVLANTAGAIRRAALALRKMAAQATRVVPGAAVVRIRLAATELSARQIHIATEAKAETD